MMISYRFAILFQILLQGVVPSTSLLVPPSSTKHSSYRQTTTSLNAVGSNNKNNKNLVASTIAASIIAAATTTATISLPAQAYVPTDYASETVEKVIQDLKDSSGNIDQTFKAYERIAGIITEGEGVGGMVNYSKFLHFHLKH